MATVAILIVYVPPRDLLWIQPQFGVTTPALNFAGRERQKQTTRKQNCENQPES
jgi:hypothetical protein